MLAAQISAFNRGDGMATSVFDIVGFLFTNGGTGIAYHRVVNLGNFPGRLRIETHR